MILDCEPIQGERRPLDVEAAANAIAYIAGRVSQPTLHKVFKVLYLAEKEHLSRYGRMIAGDTYIKMQYGPVPSAIYDGLKAVKGTIIPGPELRELAERLEDLVHVKGKQLTPIGEPDLDWLSASDVECLDESIKQYGTRAFSELTTITHDAAWDQAPENGPMTVEAIASTLDNSETVLSYLRGDDDV